MADISRRAVVVAAGGSAATAAAGVLVAKTRAGTEPISGRPVRTSFGSVTVVASSRISTTTRAPERAERSAHGGHPAGRSAGDAGAALVASAVHGAWSDGVVVDVEVHNRLSRPVELSPGQFRVRVDGAGPTVSLYSSDRDAAPLGPGSSASLRITYLAPPPDHGLSLEFDDTGATKVLALGTVGRRHPAGAL